MLRKTERYDVIVVGSGSGTIIVDAALNQGLKVALIDDGPVGGTCLTVGCIPSKVLVHPADRIMEIREAAKLGIETEIKGVDFDAIMQRMRAIVEDGQSHVKEGIRSSENLDFYGVTSHFVDSHTMDVGGQRIKGDKIFLVSGARPAIPPIEGIERMDYLTNESVLALTRRPESLIMVGGGYIGAEYAHFFEAMGTRVIIIQRNERLVPREEPEVSDLLRAKLAERMDVRVQMEAVEVRRSSRGVLLMARDVRTGQTQELEAERIMIAAGRKSNADKLRTENAGIRTDARGYIIANEYLETNVKNVWALGDALGKKMFKHSANQEASLAWHNATHDHKAAMDYSLVPHAIFSHPHIASVGLGEEEARREHRILVGYARYMDVAKGEAMLEMDGFAKAIVDYDTEKVLGFHIIGPHAPILIQEVIDCMAVGGTVSHLFQGLHIHPALPEVVLEAFGNLHEHG